MHLEHRSDLATNFITWRQGQIYQSPMGELFLCVMGSKNVLDLISFERATAVSIPETHSRWHDVTNKYMLVARTTTEDAKDTT